MTPAPLEITLEDEDETHQTFAHITLRDGVIFGKAAEMKSRIPIGTWVSVGLDQQPAIGWYLTRHCGFIYRVRIDPSHELYDDEILDVYRREL